jgi:hypothetical protein
MMTGENRSRRDVLRAGAGLLTAGALGASAGCTQVQEAVPGLGGGGSGRAKQAPEDSQAVGYVDVQATLNSKATTEVVNAYLGVASQSEYYEGPEDYEEALETAEDESDLDPSGLQWAVGFGDYSSDEPYGGVLFNSNWAEDDVVDAIEETGSDLDDDEYEGQTIYVPQGEYATGSMGVLGNGKFVVGSENAVEDTIDVSKGNEDPIEQELAGAFNSTQNSGLVRFAGEVPDDTIPDSYPPRGDDSIDLSAFQDVPYAGGSLYTKSGGDTVGMEMTMQAEDNSHAEDLKEQTEALITLAENREGTPSDAEDILSEITVQIRNNTNVAISYEAPLDDVVDSIEGTAETLYGQG